MALIRADVRPALSRGFWGVADQALVSLGTFLFNLLLARHLPVEEFGVYALILGVLLFLNTLHASLVVYPLSIRGAAADEAGLRSHAGAAVSAVAILALPLWVVPIGAACAAIGRIELTPWALAAAGLWQVQETLRRAFMAHLRHREAVPGDAVSYLGQAGAMWALAQAGWLRVDAALGAMALTSALGAAVQASQLGLGRSIARRGLWAFVRRSSCEGRWFLMTNLTMGAMTQTFNWTLMMLHGLAQVATVEAVATLLKVTHPVLFGAAGLIVPATARAYRDGGIGHARRAGWAYAAPGAALVLPYLAVVLVWPVDILRVFYGPTSPYLQLASLVRLMVLCYALTYLALMLGAVLGGLEKTRLAFRAQCASVLAGLVVGVPLIVRAGAAGLITGASVAAGVRAIVSGWFVARESREQDRAKGRAPYEVSPAAREVADG